VRNIQTDILQCAISRCLDTTLHRFDDAINIVMYGKCDIQTQESKIKNRWKVWIYIHHDCLHGKKMCCKHWFSTEDVPRLNWTSRLQRGIPHDGRISTPSTEKQTTQKQHSLTCLQCYSGRILFLQSAGFSKKQRPEIPRRTLYSLKLFDNRFFILETGQPVAI